MGDEIWGATGVRVCEPHSISPDNRYGITTVVNSANINDVNFDILFNKLQDGISRFKAHESISAESSPSKTKKNLSMASDTAKRLARRLSDLDGNAKQYLSNEGNDAFITLLRDATRIANALSKANGIARDRHKGAGRLLQPHRLWLAIDVADAIKDIGAPVTTTKNGLFVAILEIVLWDATGREPKEVTELARKALKNRDKLKIITESGSIEYGGTPI